MLTEIPAESVDLLFLDPPYNLGKTYGDFVERWPSDSAYLDWCWQWLPLALRSLRPHASCYFMASTQMMPHFDLYFRQHLHILSRVVWTYDSSGVQARKHYGSLYEPLLFAVKDPKFYTFNAESIQVEAPTGSRRRLIDYRKSPPQVYASTKTPGNVWYFPRVRYRMPEYVEHPSQKPEALLERIILASSNPGEVVLDPFAGTGTTAAVAQRLGRHSISIERNADYTQAALMRLGWA